MAVSDKSCGQSLIPSFLYSSPSSSSFTRTFPLNYNMFVQSSLITQPNSSFVIPAPSEPPSTKIEFLVACFEGGALSCGLTHLAFTPLDLAKLNMQIYPKKYKSIWSGVGVVFKEQGVRGLFRGWVRALITYPVHGACKFGFYEFFKKDYSDIAGPEYAAKYKTLIYLASSASSQVVAGYVLSRFEVLKLTAQTTPAFYQRFLNSRGTANFSIVPLWGRQAVKKVGFQGLFTHGLPLRIAMIGTLSGAQWGIYDAFKLYVGLPNSGGVAHAAVEL